MKQTVKVRGAALAILAALALVGCSHPQPAEAQDWYTATGVPSTGSLASSAAMRGEFQLIQNAFGRLPALSGNNNEAIFVNAGGTALEAVDAATARDRLGLELGTDVQAYDADLAALAGLSSTGIIARTGSGTAAVRSITTSGEGLSASNGDGVSANPAISLADDVAAIEALDSTGFPVRTGSSTWSQRSIAVSGSGLSISNGNGVSGNPTISVADDLAAVEALSTTGLAARTGTNTWAARTLSVSGDGLAVTNGNGVSGNPTLALDDDLAAVEALSSTGCVARTASNTWNVRTITGTSNEVSVTNGNCVSGNPTISLPSSLTFTGKTVTGGTFDEPEITDAEISGGTIDNAAIGGTTPASGSFTDITVNSSPSAIYLVNPSGGTNNKRWRIAGLNNGNFQIGTVSDAGAFTSEIFRIQRSGTSANGIYINSSVQAAGITDSLPGTSDSSVVTIAGTQTLTNKTLSSPTLTTPVLSGTASGTTAGRLGYSSGALTYGDGSSQQTVVTETRTQTLTNKTLSSPTLTSPTINGATISGDIAGNSSAPCPSGYERIGINYCARRVTSAGDILVIQLTPCSSLTPFFSHGISVPSGRAISRLDIELIAEIRGTESAGMRSYNPMSYNSVSRCNVGSANGTALFGRPIVGYEPSGIDSSTAIASGRVRLAIDPDNAPGYIGPASGGVIYYRILGYWDN